MAEKSGSVVEVPVNQAKGIRLTPLHQHMSPEGIHMQNSTAARKQDAEMET